jgi:hypothetical protein
LILQARTLTVVEHRVGAGPERYDLLDHVEDVTKLSAEGVRPIVVRTIILRAPHQLETGPLSTLVNSDTEIGLIILKAYVVARLVLTDQVTLE